MLRQTKHESLQDWTRLHSDLSKYYADRRRSCGATHALEPLRRSYVLEELYHTICAQPAKALSVAADCFVRALDDDVSFARQCAVTIEQAGKDSELDSIKTCGMKLIECVDHYNGWWPMTALWMRLPTY
jgi:hypothetical protein